MADEDTHKQQDLAYYTAAVEAWFVTAMEFDKSIFTLSTGGLVVLVTLLTTVGIDSLWVLVGYVAALLCFLTSIGAMLGVLHLNKARLVEIMKGNFTPNPVLACLDKTMLISFGVGLIFTAAVGVSTAISTFNKHAREDKNMAIERKVIQPGTIVEKSFNQAHTMRPTAPAPASSTTTTTNSTSTQAPAPQVPASGSQSESSGS